MTLAQITTRLKQKHTNNQTSPARGAFNQGNIMCWSGLNNFELQAIRKLLMLDVTEAAELIGNVSTRSWQYWESGERTIPDDVESEMFALSSIRNEIITGVIVADEDERKQKWYPTFESFAADYPLRNRIMWRIHQSVLSYLFCEVGEIELLTDIETDKETYIYKYFTSTRDEDIEHQKMEKIFLQSNIK